jgi:hypothetical protein
LFAGSGTPFFYNSHPQRGHTNINPLSTPHLRQFVLPDQLGRRWQFGVLEGEILEKGACGVRGEPVIDAINVAEHLAKMT